MNSERVFASIRAASSLGSVSDGELVSLILLSDLIVVVDCKEMMQQQAFAVSEIDCAKIQERDSVHIRISLSRLSSSSNSMVSTCSD